MCRCLTGPAPLRATALPALHDVTPSPCGATTPTCRCPCPYALHTVALPPSWPCVLLPLLPAHCHSYALHAIALAPCAPSPLCPTRRHPIALLALHAAAPTPLCATAPVPCVPPLLHPARRRPCTLHTERSVSQEEKRREEKREEAEKRSVTYGEGRRVHGRIEITKATLRLDFNKSKMPWIELSGP
jgi:hypothetical protein